jgi:GrpB-like predicted nucleotidyltransferase (UPF0157 family)
MAREVRIELYNPAWKDQYTQTEHILRGIFNDLIIDIQHIGSTSIEGLSAKPIINILIVVNNIEAVDTFNDTMAAHGFLAKGEYGIPGRRYFSGTLLSDPGVSTHHVHMYQVGNPKYQEELLFRDYLRIDEGVLRAYEALKIELAERLRHDPGAYTDAKADFIRNTIHKACTYLDR